MATELTRLEDNENVREGVNQVVLDEIEDGLYGVLSKSVAGGNVTLSAAEALLGVVRCTGAPGVARELVYPSGATGARTISNECGQNVTVKNAVGDTGKVVSAGLVAVILLDGTNANALPRPTSAPTGDTVMYRDAAGRAQVEDPSADKDIANKQWVLAQIAAIP